MQSINGVIMSLKLISFEDLNALKGIRYSRDHVRRMAKAGAFPKPISVGAARIAWVESEVDEWLKGLPIASSAA